MSELKPCPFCGGAAYITGGEVLCSSCHATVDYAHTWNHRPAEDDILAENARLKKQLENVKAYMYRKWHGMAREFRAVMEVDGE